MILETLTNHDSGNGNNGTPTETTFDDTPEGRSWLHEEEAIVYGRIARAGSNVLELAGYTVDVAEYARTDQRPI